MRELNRALLARQLLLERSELPLERVLEAVGGIQAQYAPSTYIGLWTRMRRFERADLDRALDQRRVVQATLMRITIHLVSREDYWPLAVATRAARQRTFLRARRDVSAADMEAAGAALRSALSAGPLWRRELEGLVRKDLFVGIGGWVDMVRVPPSGTWERRRADLYGLAEDWVGPCTVSSDDALELLVRRHLGAFGPATRAELASWAGMQVRDVASALERMGIEGAELDLPGAALPGADVSAPVRFLPTWDAILLAHARRTGVLREDDRPRIFHIKNPHSESTFMVDGVVAGTWRYADGAVQLSPFRSLGAAARAELEREAAGLAALHA